jgi:hypothetical protein
MPRYCRSSAPILLLIFIAATLPLPLCLPLTLITFSADYSPICHDFSLSFSPHCRLIIAAFRRRAARGADAAAIACARLYERNARHYLSSTPLPPTLLPPICRADAMPA